ncbi:MAG: NAD(P)H-hydrate epimerase, partial [Betaproteobacteria bacterium]
MTTELAPILEIAQLRTIEAVHAGDSLMERAGRAAAAAARALAGDRGGPIVVLAGPGNNGGDAFVAARALRADYHDVVVVFAGDGAKLPEDAAAAYRAFIAAGGATVAAPPQKRP